MGSESGMVMEGRRSFPAEKAPIIAIRIALIQG
jgi:hypothetical protein